MKINWRWWLGLKPEFACTPLKYNYTISVVIPAYNEEKSIADTIRSIKNQSVKIDAIIVVDDFSSDKTGDIALYEGVQVIRTPHNMGTKALAQNYALPFINTDLFITVDADTILHPQAIERTLPYFNDLKTGSVCGFVIPQKIETIWERGRFIEYLYGISIMKAAQNNVGAVLVSSGCFSVFRTEVVKKLGGFKQRTMAEDMDLTWEMHFNHYKIFCAPDSYCYPLDPPTAKIFYKQVLRWYSAFFQNVSVHKKQLLKNKIGFFVFGYLLDSILNPFIFLALLSVWIENIILAFLLYIFIDIILVAIPCLVKASRIGMFWKTLGSVFSYPIIRFVNIYIFWKAFWNEWVIGKRLKTWDKGH
ncbi:MAG: glycosyltransferase family 2 protein [Thermodesulfovibrionales bacterium]|nr:glycosyltransferase family 2 protein [Thermodesulfovibrionales bacterium]